MIQEGIRGSLSCGEGEHQGHNSRQKEAAPTLSQQRAVHWLVLDAAEWREQGDRHWLNKHLHHRNCQGILEEAGPEVELWRASGRRPVIQFMDPCPNPLTHSTGWGCLGYSAYLPNWFNFLPSTTYYFPVHNLSLVFSDRLVLYLCFRLFLCFAIKFS